MWILVVMGDSFSASSHILQPWEEVFEHKHDLGFMETACVSSYSFAMLFAWLSSCITLCLLFSLPGSPTTLHHDELAGKSASTQWDLGSSSIFSQAVMLLPFNTWAKSFSLIYCRCFWNKRWAAASLPHVLAGDRRLCEITWEMGWGNFKADSANQHPACPAYRAHQIPGKGRKPRAGNEGQEWQVGRRERHG